VSTSISAPLRRELLETKMWDERVAREVEHQARIEAAFDRADAFDRLGHAERALEWRNRADALITRGL
jgi:hypothetical protein